MSDFRVSQLTAWRRSSDQGTSTARTDGKRSCCPSLIGTAAARRRVVVRADAAFARPEVYEALERRGLYRKSRLIQIAIVETADAVQPLNLTRTPTAVGRAP